MRLQELRVWARRIAGGHTKEKHWNNWTEVEVIEKIVEVLKNPKRSYPPLEGHPWKIYAGKDELIVIRDAISDERGSAFYPDYDGYFDDQVEAFGEENYE